MKFSLKELRARLGETQTDAAKAIGVSLPTYAKAEHDIGTIRIRTLKRLAEHFGISIDEIKVDG